MRRFLDVARLLHAQSAAAGFQKPPTLMSVRKKTEKREQKTEELDVGWKSPPVVAGVYPRVAGLWLERWLVLWLDVGRHLPAPAPGLPAACRLATARAERTVGCRSTLQSIGARRCSPALFSALRVLPRVCLSPGTLSVRRDATQVQSLPAESFHR